MYVVITTAKSGVVVFVFRPHELKALENLFSGAPSNVTLYRKGLRGGREEGRKGGRRENIRDVGKDEGEANKGKEREEDEVKGDEGDKGND